MSPGGPSIRPTQGSAHHVTDEDRNPWRTAPTGADDRVPLADRMFSDLDDEFGLIPAWPAITSLIVFLAPAVGYLYERSNSTSDLAGMVSLLIGIYLVWPLAGLSLLVTGLPVVIQRTYRLIAHVGRRRRGESI